MTTDTEALRAAFEDYVNPEGDVALHWQPAGYYAGHGVQQSWLDFQSGYWAGHAAAKAETAAAGEPVAWMTVNDDGDPLMLFFDHIEAMSYCNEGEVPIELFTADQLAAAVAAAQGDAEDAARYRWLRDAGLMWLPYEDNGCGPEFPSREGLDAAIDLAREKP